MMGKRVRERQIAGKHRQGVLRFEVKIQLNPWLTVACLGQSSARAYYII